MPQTKKKRIVSTDHLSHWSDLLDAPKYLTKDEEYTNTIELYDAIPKFFSRDITSKAVAGEEIVKKFTYRGVAYEITITPAPLTDSFGNKYARFPGKSEEVIEDIIRKFATDGKKYIHTEYGLGVTFTLYELRNELKKRGKTKSIDEIKESLVIMNMSHITLRCNQEDRKMDIYSSPFPKLILASREAIDKLGKNIKCSVSLHPLVSRSIKECSHRIISYDKIMCFKSVMAKRLFKRMSHLFTQAEVGKCYSLRMCKMLEDFGIKQSKDISTTLIKTVVPGLEELTAAGCLESYTVEKVDGDVTLNLFPSKEFSKTAKQANYWQGFLKAKAPTLEE